MAADGRTRDPLPSRVLAILRYYLVVLKELPTRLLDFTVRHLPMALRRRTLRSFARAGIPWPFEIGLLNPRQDEYLQDMQVALPATLLTVPPALPELSETGHYWPPVRTYRLTGVAIDPGSGLVFADERLIPQSGDGLRDPSDTALLAAALPRIRSAVPSDLGPVLPVAGTNYKYYHFLIEVLPRLLLSHRMTPESRVLLSEPVPSFVRMALDAVHLPYVVAPEGALTSSDVTICDPSPFGWPHPGYVELLRDLPVATDSEATHRPAPRLYISRSGSERALHEESRLEGWLEENGFRIARLEDEDWVAQVALFRSAEVVVAPHGAGLANCVFMRPGGRIIEITSGTWWYPCFQHIAVMASLDHAVVTTHPSVEHAHGTAVDVIESLTELGVGS